MRHSPLLKQMTEHRRDGRFKLHTLVGYRVIKTKKEGM